MFLQVFNDVSNANYQHKKLLILDIDFFFHIDTTAYLILNHVIQVL